MYLDCGEVGRVKNVFTKLHFSLIPATEEHPVQSLEVYEQENFIADTSYKLRVEDDFFGEYDLESRYFNIEYLVKNYDIRPLEINTCLVNYDIVYTKDWTPCGYEYDYIHEIKSIEFCRHPSLEFKIKEQIIDNKWSKYPPYYKFHQSILITT